MLVRFWMCSVRLSDDSLIRLQMACLRLCDRGQPIFTRLHARQSLRVAVGDQPERAVDDAIGQDAGYCFVIVTHEAWQHANACPRRDEAVLCVDAGRPQMRGQAGVDFVEIMQFRRVNEVRDVANEAMAVRQIGGRVWQRCGVIFRGVEAKVIIGQLARYQWPRFWTGEQNGDIRLAF